MTVDQHVLEVEGSADMDVIESNAANLGPFDTGHLHGDAFLLARDGAAFGTQDDRGLQFAGVALGVVAVFAQFKPDLRKPLAQLVKVGVGRIVHYQYAGGSGAVHGGGVSGMRGQLAIRIGSAFYFTFSR